MVKQLKIITHWPKTIANRNIVGIKSVFIQHPKTSNRLSKARRQAKRVSKVGAAKHSSSSWYSETKKHDEKNTKIAKWSELNRFTDWIKTLNSWEY